LGGDTAKVRVVFDIKRPSVGSSRYMFESDAYGSPNIRLEGSQVLYAPLFVG
jgi:hypothetical protein